MKPSVFDVMKGAAEAEGLVPGSPLYEARVTSLHVQKCQELHVVALCSDCSYADHCELNKQNLRNKRLGLVPPS